MNYLSLISLFLYFINAITYFIQLICVLVVHIHGILITNYVFHFINIPISYSTYIWIYIFPSFNVHFSYINNPPNLLLLGTSCRAILLDVQQKFYWTSSKIFIVFLDEISNSKTFEANLQNSSGRPVDSYWTSSRIQWTSNRLYHS